jgi:hypothetical protein
VGEGATRIVLAGDGERSHVASRDASGRCQRPVRWGFSDLRAGTLGLLYMLCVFLGDFTVCRGRFQVGYGP